jgi:type I restriction enzyme, R subunit
MIANRITESAIKEFAVKLLEKQGFQYVYGPDIAPDKDVQGSRK